MGLQQGWSRFSYRLLLLLSMGSAALADFLFYDRVVGWTLGGFVCWLLIVVLVRHRRQLLGGPRRSWGWLFTVMTVGVCISLLIEPGTLAFVLAMIGLGSMVLIGRGGWREARLGWAWLGQLFTLFFVSLIKPILDSRIAQRWRRRVKKHVVRIGNAVFTMTRMAWSVIGIVVPVTLSLIFLGLFSLANPVVSDWMGRFFDKLGDLVVNTTDYLTFSRLFLWYIVIAASWGLLRYRPRRKVQPVADSVHIHIETEDVDHKQHPVHAAAELKRQQQDASAEVEVVQKNEPDADPSQPDLVAWIASRYQDLIVRCLIAMNVVFALQLVLDSRYLVLGDTLPKGMTYAEYAHRGAYPLIATAILAGSLVLAVFRPGGLAERSIWARRLVLLWIAQNLVLVASAAWRLGAYVEVYTLTRLRVAAALWMLMVAGTLFLLLWRIARSRDNAWLTAGSMGWAMCVLWLCSFVPFDPMIARYNVMNCKELGGSGASIDVSYLEVLGPDALPALQYLIGNLPQEIADQPPAYEPEPDAWREVEIRRVSYDRTEKAPPPQTLRDRLLGVQGQLTTELDEQLEDWRGWTARRAWLKEVTSQ